MCMWCVGVQAQNAKTAGLIIIGDEILKGKTSDTNSLYAARRLRENGIEVRRIAVVPDEHDDILAEVQDQVRGRSRGERPRQLHAHAGTA
jgi:molybdopterin biosynthesis enzyme